jgi:hypothetical protein
MSNAALLGCEPFRIRITRQHEEDDDCEADGHAALDYEQILPALILVSLGLENGEG